MREGNITFHLSKSQKFNFLCPLRLNYHWFFKHKNKKYFLKWLKSREPQDYYWVSNENFTSVFSDDGLRTFKGNYCPFFVHLYKSLGFISIWKPFVRIFCKKFFQKDSIESLWLGSLGDNHKHLSVNWGFLCVWGSLSETRWVLIQVIWSLFWRTKQIH